MLNPHPSSTEARPYVSLTIIRCAGPSPLGWHPQLSWTKTLVPSYHSQSDHSTCCTAIKPKKITDPSILNLHLPVSACRRLHGHAQTHTHTYTHSTS